MTRGKHGAAAAVRHEVQSAAEQIETYKRAVMRLTQERNDARAALEAEKARNRQAERKLAAERDHGVSPRVQALEALLAKSQRENEAARKELRRRDLTKENISIWAFHHLTAVHGMGRADGAELLSRLSTGAHVTPEEFEATPYFNQLAAVQVHRRADVGDHGELVYRGADIGDDGARAIQRARGVRS